MACMNDLDGVCLGFNLKSTHFVVKGIIIMKSVIFSLFSRRGLNATLASAVVLGAVGVVGGAFAATGTGDASATVVTPIGFTSAAPLAFGKFTNAAGTVSVNSAGTRSATTASALLITGSAHTAGQLDVTGDVNATYSISLTGGDLTSGVNTMALGSLSAAASTATGTPITTGTLDGTGVQSLKIGGALTVGGTQVAGTYTGTYAVTLEYN